MTMHRFPEQPDKGRSAISPVRTRQVAANAPAVHNHQDDWSAPHEAQGQRLLLTVSEAAQQLGIGRSLLYELLADGQVESIHVGRLRRIPIDALADYIDRQRPNRPGVAMLSCWPPQSNLATPRHHQGHVQTQPSTASMSANRRQNLRTICGQTIKKPDSKSSNPASDLGFCVGDTGIEPVTSSV